MFENVYQHANYVTILQQQQLQLRQFNWAIFLEVTPG